MGRTEESVTFLQQAAAIYVELGDTANEGRARNNLAIYLIKLRRHDAARRELQRAIECCKPFGHAAQPWKTWDILCDLEIAVKNPQAAAAARQKAIDAYLAYRRAGGESQNLSAQLYALVGQAIQGGNTVAAEQFLTQLSESEDTPDWGKILNSKLQAILRGERNPALAADPNLDYTHVAELQLLLEGLQGK